MSGHVLIWSGEHHAYWRPNSAGYTIDGLAAGIYARADAERIVNGCDPEKRVEIREIDPSWPIFAVASIEEAANGLLNQLRERNGYNDDLLGSAAAEIERLHKLAKANNVLARGYFALIERLTRQRDTLAAEQPRASTPAVGRDDIAAAIEEMTRDEWDAWVAEASGSRMHSASVAATYRKADAILALNPDAPASAVLPCVPLVSRQHDPDCGCPEEEYDTPWGYLFLHLSAGGRSEAALDMGDEGEREIAILAPTIDAARVILFAWAAIPDAISDSVRVA